MSQLKGYRGPLEPAGPCQWRIPKSYRPTCAVDGLIFADDKLIEQIKHDQAPEQVVNVAFLPGIQNASLAMPDIHWGYGFCIGGVCDRSEEGGVISPGGVGYDINCGVRSLRHRTSFLATSRTGSSRSSTSSSATFPPASASAAGFSSTRAS